MEGNLSRDVLSEFGTALATQRVDLPRTGSRTLPNILDARYCPPQLLRGILLFQNTVRRKQFRKNFGDVEGMGPASPQVELALYMCRRIRNPAWVDIPKEALGLGAILFMKERLPLSIIIDVHARYLAALGASDQGVQILAEKKHLVVVQIQEELDAEMETVPDGHDWGLRVRCLIDRVGVEWYVPPASAEEVFRPAEDILENYFNDTLQELKEQLIQCTTTPSIQALKKEGRNKLLGVYLIDFESAVHKARRQRVNFLINELETRWKYPLEGPLGPYLVADEQYTTELTDDCPQRTTFVHHVKQLRIHLETKAEGSFEEAKTRLDKIKRARDNAPQVKSVLKEFDGMLEEALVAAQKLVPEWGEKIGVVHSIVHEHAEAFLTPRSFDSFYRTEGERCALDMRDPTSSIGVINEASNTLSRVINILGNSEREEEWLVEFPMLRCSSPSAKTVIAEDFPDSPASSAAMPEGFEMVEGISMGHGQRGFHTQQFSNKAHVAPPNYAATLELLQTFEQEPCEETLTQPPPVTDGDETQEVASSVEQAENGTQVVPHKKKFEDPRPKGLEGGGRVLAQLTLFDLSMDDVYEYSEEVLATKFVKAIADAGGIEPSRLRVLGFRPGSVKIFLEVDASVIFEVLREVQGQLRVSDSRLRNSDIGHLLSPAVAFESIPRNAFCPTPQVVAHIPATSQQATCMSWNSEFREDGMSDRPKDFFGVAKQAEPPSSSPNKRETEEQSIIYRTTLQTEGQGKNPHGSHPSYSFYVAPTIAPSDRKWDPYAKFVVTRYPVRAPVNYNGYQSWCDLGTTMDEWIPEGTDNVARKFGKKLSPPEEETTVEPLGKVVPEPLAESDYEEEVILTLGEETQKFEPEQLPDEAVTVRLGPGPEADPLDETARLYPPIAGEQGPADDLAATKLQANFRGMMSRKRCAVLVTQAGKEEIASPAESVRSDSATESVRFSPAETAREVTPVLSQDIVATDSVDDSAELAAEMKVELEAEIRAEAALEIAAEMPEIGWELAAEISAEMEAEMEAELNSERAAQLAVESGECVPTVVGDPISETDARAQKVAKAKKAPEGKKKPTPKKEEKPAPKTAPAEKGKKEEKKIKKIVARKGKAGERESKYENKENKEDVDEAGKMAGMEGTECVDEAEVGDVDAEIPQGDAEIDAESDKEIEEVNAEADVDGEAPEDVDSTPIPNRGPADFEGVVAGRNTIADFEAVEVEARENIVGLDSVSRETVVGVDMEVDARSRETVVEVAQEPVVARDARSRETVVEVDADRAASDILKKSQVPAEGQQMNISNEPLRQAVNKPDRHVTLAENSKKPVRARSGSPTHSRKISPSRSQSPERPRGDLSHLHGVSSWVGMLSGIQGTGLRGPVTKADDYIEFRKEQKQSDPVMASFASPVFIRQQYRNLMTGLGPPYNTQPKNSDAFTWWPVSRTMEELDNNDWARSQPLPAQRRTKLGPKQSVRHAREVSPPTFVGSPGNALRKHKARMSSTLPAKPKRQSVCKPARKKLEARASARSEKKAALTAEKGDHDVVSSLSKSERATGSAEPDMIVPQKESNSQLLRPLESISEEDAGVVARRSRAKKEKNVGSKLQVGKTSEKTQKVTTAEPAQKEAEKGKASKVEAAKTEEEMMPPHDDREASVPPQEEMEASVPPQEEMEASIPPQEEMEASMPPQEEMEASMPPQEEMEASVPPQEEMEASVRPQESEEDVVVAPDRWIGEETRVVPEVVPPLREIYPESEVASCITPIVMESRSLPSMGSTRSVYSVSSSTLVAHCLLHEVMDDSFQRESARSLPPASPSAGSTLSVKSASIDCTDSILREVISMADLGTLFPTNGICSTGLVALNMAFVHSGSPQLSLDEGTLPTVSIHSVRSDGDSEIATILQECLDVESVNSARV